MNTKYEKIVAAMKGDKEKLLTLISDKNLDDGFDEDGTTLLHISSHYGQMEIVEYLVRKRKLCTRFAALLFRPNRYIKKSQFKF